MSERGRGTPAGSGEAGRPLRIGLAYDLKEEYLAAGYSALEVMEFDDEEVIAGLAGAMAELGHAVERLGRGVEVARRLAAGERWDLVVSIAEGLEGRSREAQVPALCELFGQPYAFSDPLTCAVTLDKAVAKRIVRDHGLPTAPFEVIRELDDLSRLEALAPPLFLKPLAEGSSKGISGGSLVREPGEAIDRCRELLAALGQPVLAEEFLPGREVTVGVLGNGRGMRAVAVMEVVFTDRAEAQAYTTLNKAEYERRVAYRLLDGDPFAEQARTLALAAARALECRDVARVDLRADGNGTLHFLEVNPLPGLHPVRSDLPIMARLAGLSYRELVDEILTAARQRYGL
ncbi:MAG: D-alanine--D-alanine ligase [Acidobacteriota bacterium]|jgi:D-alanine-D-alanine ligase